MKDMHCPNKLDSEKPLYRFSADIICNELISALKDYYEHVQIIEVSDSSLYLVPSGGYFMRIKDPGWLRYKTIEVTKEQVDKFLALHTMCAIPFLKFMENEYE